MELNRKVNTDRIKETAVSPKLSMVGFIIDLPNACTLFGLLSSTLGIYFAIIGQIHFAVIGVSWAVLFDWLDGLIASKLKNRTGKHKEFGAQLDSLVDIVSFGVLPAVILLSYSGFDSWFFPGVFLIVAACAIRLSYFNIYGLSSVKCYTGLPVDNNGLIVAFAFLFESHFSQEVFSIILYVLIIILVVLNLSSFQIPKFSKKAIYGIGAFVLFESFYLGC